ncbi:MAG TPA: DUF5668 domain-containing protein [Candidatus Limnocylindria bacterium]
MENRPSRSPGWGGVAFALLLIGVGGWYLLRNTFGLDLPELDGETVWPILVVLLGVAILVRAMGRRSEAP